MTIVVYFLVVAFFFADYRVTTKLKILKKPEIWQVWQKEKPWKIWNLRNSVKHLVIIITFTQKSVKLLFYIKKIYHMNNCYLIKKHI